MRQALIILAVAGAAVSPISFAQSVQNATPRPSTTEAGSAARDVAPTSKAHRAMASFNSLLREAALQAQSAQRAAAATQRPVAETTQPTPDERDALASTPEPVH